MEGLDDEGEEGEDVNDAPVTVEEEEAVAAVPRRRRQ